MVWLTAVRLAKYTAIQIIYIRIRKPEYIAKPFK